VLLILGTRPEAIKLAPLYLELRRRAPAFEPLLCLTGQHAHLVDPVLQAFGIQADANLAVMQSGQTLAAAAARILAALEPVLERLRPDLVLVQGDTTTTLYGALAAFYARIPVGHVEAGLRTGDLALPFPEEMNRVVTARLAALHFAATERGRAALLSESVAADRIWVTGNTGIDAVLHVAARLKRGEQAGWSGPAVAPDRHLVVVTAHRRESFGEGMARIAAALRTLAARPDVEIVYPVHPNPNVRGVMEERLGDCPHLHLVPPLDYVPFVDLLRRATLILTDSGGIQEEGPSLGKPVLVLRENTERPEAVDAGTVELVGTDPDAIVRAASRLLDDPAERARRSLIHNPYGDGRASTRISDAILTFFRR
jgi:UDP-N-acetylglucosamine 2-epimerase (non-hydrolysing)